jgi:predicted acyltransferase
MAHNREAESSAAEESAVGSERDVRRDRSTGRLVSLDAFRGATIAGMILVNNPGSWSYVYAPLRHAEWHGWTPTDLIFPFFLFIVGVAMPISFGRRLQRGDSRRELMKHVVRRSAILFGLGLFMRLYPTFSDWDTLRIMGVLQRIAVVYLIASILYLTLQQRGRWTAVAVLLLGYWALMTLVPVPGSGAGDLSAEGNLGAFLDRLILGQDHLWQQNPWDPEGLLSSLPAVATTLLGIFTGEWITSGRSALIKVRGLLLAGIIGIVVGMLWHQLFPINKNLWTSSYVVFTAGMALLIFGLFYWTIDVRGWRTWSKPFVVYGMNAIAVFVASGLMTKTLVRWRIPIEGGETTSAYSWIYQNVFASWAGPLNGSLAFAISYILFWLAIIWILYWRKIFIKI